MASSSSSTSIANLKEQLGFSPRGNDILRHQLSAVETLQQQLSAVRQQLTLRDQELEIKDQCLAMKEYQLGQLRRRVLDLEEGISGGHSASLTSKKRSKDNTEDGHAMTGEGKDEKEEKEMDKPAGHGDYKEAVGEECESMMDTGFADIHAISHPELLQKAVQVHLGMGGLKLTVPLDAGITFELLLARIHEMGAAAADIGVALSSQGLTINTLHALLECHSKGEYVYATFFHSIDRMSLAAVANELACGDCEFKGHTFTLSKLPAGSKPRAVADYLWNNQVLLTSAHAQQLFDQLLPKFGNQARHELITALHSFCVEQHHVWEPDDGMSECTWAHMCWPQAHLHIGQRRVTRGRLCIWGRADAAEASSTDTWPQLDVCGLRDVARARRAGQERPLESMKFLNLINRGWRDL